MKRFGLLLTLVAGTGVAMAQTTTPPEGASSSDASKGAKTVRLSAEVVSADETARTITVKPADAGSATSTTGTTGTGAGDAMKQKTLMVEGKAVSNLKDVKSGDKVTLTCRSDMAGSSSTGASAPTGTSSTSGTTGTSGTSGTTGTTGTTSMPGTSASADFARDCSSVTAISKSY